MPRQFALLDALVPSLLLVFIISFLLQLLLDRICKRFDVYQYVWHPPLFRISLFVCLFSSLGLLVIR